MATHQALPPHIHLTSSQPVPSTTALSNIQSYLSLTASHAYLHPDVIFTSSGPTINSSLEVGGLVLHQLRRVEAGLRGEYIAVELADLERMRSRSGTPVATALGGDLPISNDSRLDGLIARSIGAGANVEAAGQDDATQNYQEQLHDVGMRDDIGDIGSRSNYVGEVDHIPTIKTTHPSPSKSKKRPFEGEEGGPMDKAARKRAKKARMTEEKVKRQGERMAGRELEIAQEEAKVDTSHAGVNGEQQSKDTAVADDEDNRDQTTYQGDEVPQQPRGKPIPDTPDVYRADVSNSILNGHASGDVDRSGADGKPRKKKKSRKNEEDPAPGNVTNRISEGARIDLDTELARDSAEKVSKVERMEGRTPVKDDGVAGKVEPASSPVPGTKENGDVQVRKKRSERKKEKNERKKRKSEAVDVD